jgi:hypothetical protein
MILLERGRTVRNPWPTYGADSQVAHDRSGRTNVADAGIANTRTTAWVRPWLRNSASDVNGSATAHESGGRRLHVRRGAAKCAAAMQFVRVGSRFAATATWRKDRRFKIVGPWLRLGCAGRWRRIH